MTQFIIHNLSDFCEEQILYVDDHLILLSILIMEESSWKRSMICR